MATARPRRNLRVEQQPVPDAARDLAVEEAAGRGRRRGQHALAHVLALHERLQRNPAVGKVVEDLVAGAHERLGLPAPQRQKLRPVDERAQVTIHDKGHDLVAVALGEVEHRRRRVGGQRLAQHAAAVDEIMRGQRELHGLALAHVGVEDGHGILQRPGGELRLPAVLKEQREVTIRPRVQDEDGPIDARLDADGRIRPRRDAGSQGIAGQRGRQRAQHGIGVRVGRLEERGFVAARLGRDAEVLVQHPVAQVVTVENQQPAIGQRGHVPRRKGRARWPGQEERRAAAVQVEDVQPAAQVITHDQEVAARHGQPAQATGGCDRRAFGRKAAIIGRRARCGQVGQRPEGRRRALALGGKADARFRLVDPVPVAEAVAVGAAAIGHRQRRGAAGAAEEGQRARQAQRVRRRVPGQRRVLRQAPLLGQRRRAAVGIAAPPVLGAV